jgi:hypothetical protein
MSLVLLGFAPAADAATAPVQLGTANAFGLLGGSTITNTGNSVINGDLGLSPGTAVTGFPPGIVNGTMHVTDAVALQAKADLTTAYLDAAGRSATATVAPDLGGTTFVPGVYRTGAVPALGLTGNVTLDAQGDPNAVFIFQVESTLTTATDSSVTLANGAQSCNVYWQVGSSATLGTRTSLRGNVLALSSISVNDAATVDGRLLARNAAVTLINDTISIANCAAGTTGGGGGGGGVGGGGGGGGTAVTDRTGPSIRISGPPRLTGTPGCTTRDFLTRVALADNAGIRRASVYLDGRLVKSTRLTRVALYVRIHGLTIGRHRITVIAFDRLGNRSTTSRAFARCQIAAPAPHFTG